MRLFRYPILCFFLFLVGASFAIADNLPDPPEGLGWYDAKNGVGTFLKPAGWHIKEEVRGDTRALFISRESIDAKGQFLVGFSVNKISEFSQQSDLRPSAFAKTYIGQVVSDVEVLTSGVVDGGAVEMNLARVVSLNGDVRTVVHHISIGWDERDEVFLIIAEAPEAEWDANYHFLGPMLNYFLL